MPIANFDKVELLLPMTGANNGTVFTDYSFRKRTVTRVGDAKTVTAQSKFSEYGSSAYFDGTGDNLSTASNAGLQFGSGPFTIGFWARLDGNQKDFAGMLSHRTSSSIQNQWSFLFGNTSFSIPTSFAFEISFNGTSAGNTATRNDLTIGNAVWRYFSACRDGNTVYLGLDGDVTEHTVATTALHASTAPLLIGRLGNYNEFKGWMQDLIILKGSALFTANFTPPARMTQRTLTRANTGTDSHEFDRAVLFDWHGEGGQGKAVTPNEDGNFEATDLIDLEYGVAFIRDGCNPICRGPYNVDGD
jgi:hypothetical protein